MNKKNLIKLGIVFLTIWIIGSICLINYITDIEFENKNNILIVISITLLISGMTEILLLKDLRTIEIKEEENNNGSGRN